MDSNDSCTHFKHHFRLGNILGKERVSNRSPILSYQEKWKTMKAFAKGKPEQEEKPKPKIKN
jgi:hypothetical protein